MTNNPFSLHDDDLILGMGIPIGITPAQPELVALFPNELIHTHCIGKSRYGKSYWLAYFAVMLMHRGISITVLDKTGDLCPLILKLLIDTGYFDQNSEAFDRIVYLDLPTALKRQLFVPMNILNLNADPYAAANTVVDVFKRVFPDLQEGHSSTIETLVKMSAFVLASHHKPLLPFMDSLLNNAAYRDLLLQGITDEVVLGFFERWFAGGRQRSSAFQQTIEPTRKRISSLAFSPAVRYSLGQQGYEVLKYGEIIQKGQSFLINLNLPDPDALRLLGSILTVSAEVGALSRSAIPAASRTGTHMLIIDEAQNFIAGSDTALRTILDECRKYGLFLCLAHQSWSQFPPALRGALNNCDMEVTFALERDDAIISEPRLHFPTNQRVPKPITFNPFRPFASGREYYSSAEMRELQINAITNLAKREAFVKLPNGELYWIETPSVEDPNIEPEELAAVEQEYLRRYFRPQALIEAEINQELDRARSASTTKMPSATMPNDPPQDTTIEHGEASEDDDEDILRD